MSVLIIALMALAMCSMVVGFTSLTSSTHRSSSISMGIAPRPSGFSSTRAGKAAIIDRTKTLLDNSQMVITIPSEGITKENIDLLRKDMPQGVKASVVKNTLMKVAVQDTPFEKIQDTLNEANMFFFIPEGEAKPAFKAYKAWAKEVKREAEKPKMAVMDGQSYTGKGVDQITSLPTKLELITQIAIGIKAVPTKIGKGVNAVPTKLGRAFALVKDQKEE